MHAPCGPLSWYNYSMRDAFTPLRSTIDLEAALQQSYSEPVLVMKHSRTCGVSAQAFDEVQEWLNRNEAARVYLVTVQTDREVARAITDRLNVRHESPQMLILRDGRAAWHASHYHVTSNVIEKALASILEGTPAPSHA